MAARGMRTIALSLVLTGAALLTTGRAEDITDTTPVPPTGALGGPFRDLTPDEMEQFKRGRRIFDRDWRLSQGVGTPDFNGDSCRGCHKVPVIGGSGGLDVNVFRFARDFGGAGPFTDLDGGQMGSKLRRPDVPGREDAHPDADVFEQRNTPPLYGLGLIDSIADADILTHEDPTDTDGDGIFGVARLVDAGGILEVGKYGWKAQLPKLVDFLNDPLGGELGITVPDNGRGFGMLTDADSVADPEITQADFDDAIFYMLMLAPPPRAGSLSPLVPLGEQVFAGVGCATCHTPSLPGSEGPVPLYSDMLLHDVYPDTFRGMAEPGADVGMYRTPPLWGARLSAPYMHDGRAETLLDAVLIHDGEASGVIADFLALPAAEQDALVAFLGDL